MIKRQTAVTEQIIVYSLLAVAGALAGFARFLRSRHKWDARYVAASCLVGSMLGIIVVGYTSGEKAVENPWGCLAIVLAIGLVQPNAGLILNSILKSRGIDLMTKD